MVLLSRNMQLNNLFKYLHESLWYQLGTICIAPIVSVLSFWVFLIKSLECLFCDVFVDEW